MLKKTIKLFIKACIVGIVINVGVAQLPSTSGNVSEDVVHQEDVVHRMGQDASLSSSVTK